MTDSPGSATNTWIRTHTRRPDAEINLVCLPHAGGSASYYRRWGSLAVPEIEVHVVQYPGREDRLIETPIRSMSVLADAVSEAIAPLFERPVVLFGHSMGACLMYEVALRAERAGRDPALLVASGSSAPHRRERRSIHSASDAELLDELRREAATDSAVLESPELLELLLPMVRGDYELIETYHPAAPEPLRTPLTVFRGADDADVDETGAAAWSEVTATGALRHHQVFAGDHFYLRDPDEVLSVLGSFVGSLSTQQQA
ncbi:pyochelin biosynthetic protein PchC [Prauserella aidingensis]|uniref:thioesterase II family protein n=1 Tax=Prauserella aidingensis TaxID=387890 RepID=UPI0020A3A30A|nr:alpha/beta fold hydrolase [Prauserella aidingensis]MCP2253727.1 pyochelin biosynthetic protein PchC [Prauserella aidingensis]